MKNLVFYFSILLLIFIQEGAYAQIITTKPQPKQNTNYNTQPSTANKLTLKIAPNLSCQIKIDGEDKGIINADEIKKIYLTKGSFLITAISTENALDKLSEEYVVAEVNIEKFYKIDLLSKRETRIAKIQADADAKAAIIAKIKADSIATAKTKAEAQALLDEIKKNMVFVKGGTFQMGCTSEQGTDCGNDEKPAHSVSLSDFYIGKYEVTQKQWKGVMGTNPSSFNTCGDNCPVENISWNDVQEFVAKLNTITGNTYRLPTEAEWEYAARGGASRASATASATPSRASATASATPSRASATSSSTSSATDYKYAGSNTLSDVAWFDENSGSKTHAVGQKAANELGIYDMSGNVWEWCSDWFKGYPGSRGVTDRTGSSRVGRGGSWNYSASLCRSALRYRNGPDGRSSGMGFRLVLVP